MDIASLGIRVTTDGVAKAETDLNKLQSTGAKVEKSAAAVAKSFDKNAMSAAALANATRGLPAQFTDIATGLASGQRPLQVLLQQGGQLKDMFGGIGPAAKALGGYIVGLINPITIAAAVAGGLAYSLYQVDQEAKQDRETLRGFQQVLNSTGNAAGQTAQGIAALSEQLARGNGEVGAYGDVLKSLIGTGEVFGPSLGKVARDVKAIGDATGKTAGQVIADYQKIFKEPAIAAVELSQKIQFLSADQFALVQRLDDTGEKGRAANIVIAALNESLTGGATSAEQYASKLGDIARKLDDIRSHPEKYNAGDLGGFSTSDAMNADLESQRKKTVADYITASLNEQEKQLAAGARESIAAQSRLAAFASPKDKLDSTLVQANKDRLAALYGVVDHASRAKIEAEYQAQVKAAKDSFTRATSTPRAKRALDFTVQDANQIREEIAAEGRLMDQRLRSQAAVVSYRASLQDMLDTRQKAIDLQVASLGMGDKEIAQQQALIAIEDDYNRKKASLERQQRNSTSEIDRASYSAQLADLEAYHDKRVQIEMKGFERADAARGSWEVGAKRAYANILDSASNVAGQTDNLFTNAFDNMANALADFATTGKLNFKGLVTSILADLAKMEIRIAASRILQSIIGAYSGGGQAFSGGGADYSANSGGLAAYNVSPYAKGGVFSGSPSLSTYSGQIVSQPTMFAFAKGAGIMGEAGPEAILPLRRGPDGRLGVAAQNGGAGDVQVEVNITNNGQDVQAKQTGTRRDGQKVIVDMVLEAVANDMATGGRTAKAAQQRFGLQRRGVPVSGG